MKRANDAPTRLRRPVISTRRFACHASYPMRATVIDGIGVPALLRRTLPVPARSRNLLTVGPGQRQLTWTITPDGAKVLKRLRASLGELKNEVTPSTARSR